MCPGHCPADGRAQNAVTPKGSGSIADVMAGELHCRHKVNQELGVCLCVCACDQIPVASCSVDRTCLRSHSKLGVETVIEPASPDSSPLLTQEPGQSWRQICGFVAHPFLGWPAEALFH